MMIVFQASTSKTAPVTGRLSRDDEEFVSELQKMYKVHNKSKIFNALHLLRSLDLSVVKVLSQLDASVVRRSMAGNAEAERVGDRVLRRLTEFVVNSRGKNPPSSGKGPVSSGPSRGSAEKRQSDDVPRGGRPPEKVPRLGDSMSRGGPGFNRPREPSYARPLFDAPAYERGQPEWASPPSRGGMMRGGYPMSGYRPPPRGGYGRGPYY